MICQSTPRALRHLANLYLSFVNLQAHHFLLLPDLKKLFKASENCEAFIRLVESTNTEDDISTHLKDRIVLVPSPLVLKMKQPGT